MSENKVTRRAATGNAAALLLALDDLRRAIETHARSVPMALHEAMASVLEEIEALRAGGPHDEAEPMSMGAAHQAGLTPQRSKLGENHDAKRAPSGYRYKDGWLMTPPITESNEPNPTTEPAARSVIETLACWFGAPDGSPFPFGAAMGELRGYSLASVTRDQEQAIHEAFEAIFGEPYGAAPWRRALVGQLKMNAYHLESIRLQKAHGNPVRASFASSDRDGAMFGPASGADILRAIESTVPPPELTATVIDEMITKVGLNHGGRAGRKLAASVVAEFAQKLEPTKHH